MYRSEVSPAVSASSPSPAPPASEPSSSSRSINGDQYCEVCTTHFTAAPATGSPKYYFGEPVAGAAVKWVVHPSPYWSPFIERYEEEGCEGGGAREIGRAAARARGDI